MEIIDPSTELKAKGMSYLANQILEKIISNIPYNTGSSPLRNFMDDTALTNI